VTGIRKGETWGRASTAPADVEIEGGDADLGELATTRPGARVWFRPTEHSDVASAIGWHEAGRPAAFEVPIDGLRLGPKVAVNAIVLGTAPDRMRWWSRSPHLEVTLDGRPRFAGRAAAVVVASGQFLRGLDLVPRGHPGDGRAEVQIYALRAAERRAMRHRLPRGDHVPHPRIHQLAGRRVEVTVRGLPLALEADGVALGRDTGMIVQVLPAAIWVRV
jgi:hypothetical protein